MIEMVDELARGIIWGGLALIFAAILIVSLRRSIGPRSATVLGLAFVGSCLGFAFAYAAATKALAGLPGELSRGHIDEKAVVWATGLLGGGMGWFIGAVSGWFRSRHANGPRRGNLGIVVVPVALFTFAVMNLSSFHTADYSARGGEPDGILKATTITTLVAVAALVIVTLLVLAQRNRYRAAGAVVGAIVAVTILVAAGTRVSPLFPVDRAWLNAWQKGRIDAEEFAPNLQSSVPRDCPAVPAVRQRGGRWAVPMGLGPPWWLEGNVPGWLPDDFGLLTWNRNPVLGVWADGQCRAARLMIVHYWKTPKSSRYTLPNADQIGGWAVKGRPCPGNFPMEGLCLEYLAWSEEAGPGEGVRLHLQMWGIDRDVGDKIALGIPV